MSDKKCECGRTIPIRYNSTIQPKECPLCTYLETTSGKTKDRAKTSGKQAKTARQSPKAKARDNADKWFSRYIRIKYHFQIATDGTVLDRCIITGTVKAAKNMDNGHCFSRSYLTTRYDEDNCRPQNRSSNRFSGEADHYTFIDNLKAEIGAERFGRIDNLRRQTGEDTIEFYKEQSEKHRKLTHKLIQELGAKKWW